jgi:hypothetical protein
MQSVVGSNLRVGKAGPGSASRLLEALPGSDLSARCCGQPGRAQVEGCDERCEHCEPDLVLVELVEGLSDIEGRNASRRRRRDPARGSRLGRVERRCAPRRRDPRRQPPGRTGDTPSDTASTAIPGQPRLSGLSREPQASQRQAVTHGVLSPRSPARGRCDLSPAAAAAASAGSAGQRARRSAARRRGGATGASPRR